MPLFRIRRLFLYRGDFRGTTWFRDKRPPPGPPLPAGLSLSWLGEADWRSRARSIVCAPDVAEQRFRDGGRCVLVADAAGDTVHELWVLPCATWTEWIGATVPVPDGYALFAGAWTRPDWRRHSVMNTTRALGCAEACRLGRPGIYAGIEEHEIVPRAEKHARSGIFPIVPDRVLVHYQVAGLSWHRSQLPPPEMVGRCAELVRQNAANFPGLDTRGEPA